MARLVLFAMIASACNSNGSSARAEAGGSGGSGGSAGADASVPCWSADAGPPPDATASEQLGIGMCCAHDTECTVSTSICVAGRCCFPLHDSGRRCHANRDCCSGQCSCGDVCDPTAAGGGECSPFMR